MCLGFPISIVVGGCIIRVYCIATDVTVILSQSPLFQFAQSVFHNYEVPTVIVIVISSFNKVFVRKVPKNATEEMLKVFGARFSTFA